MSSIVVITLLFPSASSTRYYRTYYISPYSFSIALSSPFLVFIDWHWHALTRDWFISIVWSVFQQIFCCLRGNYYCCCFCWGFRVICYQWFRSPKFTPNSGLTRNRFGRNTEETIHWGQNKLIVRPFMWRPFIVMESYRWSNFLTFFLHKLHFTWTLLYLYICY